MIFYYNVQEFLNHAMFRNSWTLENLLETIVINLTFKKCHSFKNHEWNLMYIDFHRLIMGQGINIRKQKGLFQAPVGPMLIWS